MAGKIVSLWKAHWRGFLRGIGLLFLGVGLFAAYWWFYKLAPMRQLAELQWQSMHLEQDQWKTEQANYLRINSAPDLSFRGDHIGYYGDKTWSIWLINRSYIGSVFSACGCTEAALTYMINQEPESWQDWLKVNREKTQEEWIRDGFQKFGVTVHLPPQESDIVPLLHLLDKKRWRVLYNGPQKKPDPEVIPSFAQYNAFRWLRDSGFNPVTYALAHPDATGTNSVTVALIKYAYWEGEFPERNGLGILSFGKKHDPDDHPFPPPPPIILLRFQIIVYAILSALIFGGIALLCLSFRKRAKPDI